MCGFRVIYDTRRVRIIVNKCAVEYIARKNDCACVVCLCGGSADCVRGYWGGGIFTFFCGADISVFFGVCVFVCMCFDRLIVAGVCWETTKYVLCDYLTLYNIRFRFKIGAKMRVCW